MNIIRKESLPVSTYLQRLSATRSIAPYLCKSIGGAVAAYDTLNDGPSIDTNRMGVRMRISTDDLDRQGHIVNQAGLVLDVHKLNPVVLLGHGEQYQIPIAMAENPDTLAYTVEIGEHETYAWGYHKAADKMSSQIFDAVVLGLLRACSVGITPIEAAKVYLADRTDALYLEKTLLNEYSYCAIGVNPMALKKTYGPNSQWFARYEEAWELQCQAANVVLNTNRLDSSELLPELKKSFSAMLQTKPSSPGMNFQAKKAIEDQLLANRLDAFSAKVDRLIDRFENRLADLYERD